MAPVKKDDPTLPPPWQCLFEPTQNLTYYWDPVRNITQYERPPGAAPLPVAAPVAAPSYAQVRWRPSPPFCPSRCLCLGKCHMPAASDCQQCTLLLVAVLRWRRLVRRRRRQLLRRRQFIRR